jgi:hypothetical protein
MNHVFACPVGLGNPQQRNTSRPPLGPVGAYLAGTTLGGALSGTAIAAAVALLDLSPPTRFAGCALALAMAVLAARSEMRGTVAPFPQRRAQVPRQWLLWRWRRLTAVAFGLLIGSGVLTLLHHASAYVLAAVLLLSPGPAPCVAIGGLYGMVRGLMLVLAWVKRGGQLHEAGLESEVIITVPSGFLASIALLTASCSMILTVVTL